MGCAAYRGVPISTGIFTSQADPWRPSLENLTWPGVEPGKNPPVARALTTKIFCPWWTISIFYQSLYEGRFAAALNPCKMLFPVQKFLEHIVCSCLRFLFLLLMPTSLRWRSCRPRSLLPTVDQVCTSFWLCDFILMEKYKQVLFFLVMFCFAQDGYILKCIQSSQGRDTSPCLHDSWAWYRMKAKTYMSKIHKLYESISLKAHLRASQPFDWILQ